MRMDLKEMVVNTRNRIGSAQDRDYLTDFVNTELNLGFHDSLSYLSYTDIRKCL